MRITNFISLCLISMGVISCSNSAELLESPLSESIRVNQVGYFPGLIKTFTLADIEASSFQVVSEEGKVVYKGAMVETGIWEPSGEKLSTGDFSNFTTEGRYFIHIPDIGNSYTFSISNDIYSEAAIDALRTFYFQRTGMEMEEKYLGSFSRPGGIYDDTCYFHPSSGKSEGFISSPGGWYDAGDYGKYVVNAGIAMGSMLALHELYPDYYADGSLNIPESGNQVNDLLDEMRYEFDWLLTMQDKDGGVFHKLTSLYHDGITMPSDTHSKRFIIGKSTAASLDLAALLAQANRLYADIDPEFAETCLAAAVRAYDWALTNPEEYFQNPKGVGTGQYNDKILKEEFFWAAAELYSTTGDERYYEVIEPMLGMHTFRLEESWRNFVDNIGYYSLLTSGFTNKEDLDYIKEGILFTADSLIQLSSACGYNIPISRFVWGSNSDVTNTAIVQMYAYKLTRDAQYLDAAILEMDYIFGKNATAYSFVSGHGTKFSNNFHHRLFMADENEDAFPGFMAGGPNIYMQDYYNLKKNSNVTYSDSIPAKAYIDHAGSYASNEMCINWNGSLVFVLAFLDQVAGE
jgi:endoglucanase